MRERFLWSYYCPKCEGGLGDMEPYIKEQRDGFGDLYRIIKCRHCGELLVTGPYQTIKLLEEEKDDWEWWGLSAADVKRLKAAER